MSAFIRGKAIEARSLAILEPWLRERADNGEFVLTDKGRLSPLLQEIAGDVMMKRNGELVGIEHKSEEKYTGNLFLETWSNRNLRDPDAHARYGSNVGWLYKTRADLLFYHFLDRDLLVICKMFPLQQWAFGQSPNECGHLLSYHEVPQTKNSQMNETRGCLVPIADLERQLTPTPRQMTIRQLNLSLELAE